jgi:sarcosine oxidase gamma subunit
MRRCDTSELNHGPRKLSTNIATLKMKLTLPIRLERQHTPKQARWAAFRNIWQYGLLLALCLATAVAQAQGMSCALEHSPTNPAAGDEVTLKTTRTFNPPINETWSTSRGGTLSISSTNSAFPTPTPVNDPAGITDTNVVLTQAGTYLITAALVNVEPIRTSGGPPGPIGQTYSTTCTRTVIVAAAPPTPQFIEKVSGDNQVNSFATASTPFEVRVLDQSRQPMAGVTVRWSSGGVGDVLSATTSTTNIQGVSTTRINSYGDSAARSLTASIGIGKAVLSTTFSIRDSGAKPSITLTSPTASGTSIAQGTRIEFGSEVRANTRRLASVSVGCSGPASLGQTFTTGLPSVAQQNTFTVPVTFSVAGTYSCSASVTETTGSTTTAATTYSYVVVAPQPAPTPTRLEIVSGDLQTNPGSNNTSQLQPFSVRVLDQNGAAMPGVPIRWSSSSSSDTFTSLFSNADASGIAENRLTGVTSGDQRTITASVSSIPSVLANFTLLAAPAPIIAPTVQVSLPPNTSQITLGNSLSVTANITVNSSTLQAIRFFAGTTLIGEVTQNLPLSNTSEPRSITWTPSAAGTYNLSAQVTTTNAGTVTSNTVSVVVVTPVDNTTPNVEIENPPVGFSQTASQTKIPVTVRASALSGISRIQLFEVLSTGLVEIPGGALTPSGQNSFTARFEAGPYQTAGRVTLRAVATGNNRLGSTAERTLTFTAPVAVPKPTVFFAYPNNGERFLSNTEVAVRIVASAPGGLARIELLNENQQVVAQRSASPADFNLASLPAGNYVYYARAIDRNDQVSELTRLTFQIDNPPIPEPTVVLSVVGDASRLLPGQIFVLVEASNDATGINIFDADNSRLLGPLTLESTRRFYGPLMFDSPGVYQLFAVAMIRGEQRRSNTLRINIGNPANSVRKLNLIASPSLRNHQPGAVVTYTVEATGEGRKIIGAELVPTSNRPLTISATPPSPGPKSAKACVATDGLSGQLITNEQGTATFSLTLGCEVGPRAIGLCVKDASTSICLTPSLAFDVVPPRVAAAPEFTAESAQSIVPGQPATVKVVLRDDKGAVFVGQQINFSITKGQVATGTSANAFTASDGTASFSFTPASNLEITVKACVNSTSTCKEKTLFNLNPLVVEPAKAIIAPIQQTAVSASRVQINNVTTRMNQLRTETTFGYSNDISVNLPGGQNETKPTGGSGSGSGGGASRSDKDAKVEAQKAPRALGLFSMGDIDITRRDPLDGDGGYKVRSRGITVGADYRFSRNFVAGAALGYGRGNTNLLGTSQGKQNSRSTSASLFSQYQSNRDAYINAILSMGRSKFTSERKALDDLMAVARPNSKQVGFQTEMGYAFGTHVDPKQVSGFANVRFIPYARAQVIRATIDSFEENGSAYSVGVSAQKLRARTFAVGASAQTSFSSGIGVWVPSARAEWLHETQRSDSPNARLISGSAVLTPIDTSLVPDKTYGLVGVNLQWLSGTQGVVSSSFIGYERTFGISGGSTDRFTGGIKIPF